jgi:hypothetical protein
LIPRCKELNYRELEEVEDSIVHGRRGEGGGVREISFKKGKG